jgi:hypothetical protein
MGKLLNNDLSNANLGITSKADGPSLIKCY